MSTMTRPCPNEGMGAADVAVGQVWHNYATDPRRQAHYLITSIDDVCDVTLTRFMAAGSDAPEVMVVDVGRLLAHWQFRP